MKILVPLKSVIRLGRSLRSHEEGGPKKPGNETYLNVRQTIRYWLSSCRAYAIQRAEKKMVMTPGIMCGHGRRRMRTLGTCQESTSATTVMSDSPSCEVPYVR
jgi:hypothetical protein